MPVRFTCSFQKGKRKSRKRMIKTFISGSLSIMNYKSRILSTVLSILFPPPYFLEVERRSIYFEIHRINKSLKYLSNLMPVIMKRTAIYKHHKITNKANETTLQNPFLKLLICTLVVFNN